MAWPNGEPAQHYCDYPFEEVIDCCQEFNLFAWKIEGKKKVEKDSSGHVIDTTFELTPRSASTMGNLFTRKFGGKTFSLGAGRRVQFGCRGQRRQKRYEVKLL